MKIFQEITKSTIEAMKQWPDKDKLPVLTVYQHPKTRKMGCIVATYGEQDIPAILRELADWIDKEPNIITRLIKL